jgi:hypothetical protein
VLVRAALPLRLLLAQPGVHKPVVPSAEDNQLVFRRKRIAAVGDGRDVVHVKRTQALSGQTGERAASAGEEARAQLPPGVGVVEL